MKDTDQIGQRLRYSQRSIRGIPDTVIHRINLLLLDDPQLLPGWITHEIIAVLQSTGLAARPVCEINQYIRIQLRHPFTAEIGNAISVLLLGFRPLQTHHIQHFPTEGIPLVHPHLSRVEAQDRHHEPGLGCQLDSHLCDTLIDRHQLPTSQNRLSSSLRIQRKIGSPVLAVIISQYGGSNHR